MDECIRNEETDLILKNLGNFPIHIRQTQHWNNIVFRGMFVKLFLKLFYRLRYMIFPFCSIIRKFCSPYIGLKFHQILNNSNFPIVN